MFCSVLSTVLYSRLPKNFNHTKNPITKIKIKELDIEIRKFFASQKKAKIWRAIVPSNPKFLWDAVKLAKNLNNEILPHEMTLKNEPIEKFVNSYI